MDKVETARWVRTSTGAGDDDYDRGFRAALALVLNDFEISTENSEWLERVARSVTTEAALQERGF